MGCCRKKKFIGNKWHLLTGFSLKEGDRDAKKKKQKFARRSVKDKKEIE